MRVPDTERDGGERRRFERKPLTIKVQFEGGEVNGVAATRDIGLGGLYLATDAYLPVYAPLKLQLSFDDQNLHVDGAVAYREPGIGVGIRFNNLSQAAENILRQLLPVIETSDVEITSRSNQE